MTAQRYFTIWCDNDHKPEQYPFCWHHLETSASGARRAREDARAEGWMTRPGFDLCPTCAPLWKATDS